jgi:hypothetical protein
VSRHICKNRGLGGDTMIPRTFEMVVLSAALLAAAGACGGKLGDDRSDSKDGPAERNAAGGQGGGHDAGRAGTGNENDGVMSDRTLEACKRGFLAEDKPGKACPYITDDGRCYESANAACDCVCPREGAGAIVCVQYGGNSEHIEVFCQTT